MAERLYESERTFGNVALPARINVSWSIAGGAGGVNVVRGRLVTSVVRNGAGLYTITLDDRYQQLYACNGIVLAVAANVDMFVQCAAYVPAPAATGSTIQVRTLTANVETDPPNLAEVFVELILSNSTLDQ
jgi:hypothetical protein